MELTGYCTDFKKVTTMLEPDLVTMTNCCRALKVHAEGDRNYKGFRIVRFDKATEIEAVLKRQIDSLRARVMHPPCTARANWIWKVINRRD